MSNRDKIAFSANASNDKASGICVRLKIAAAHNPLASVPASEKVIPMLFDAISAHLVRCEKACTRKTASIQAGEVHIDASAPSKQLSKASIQLSALIPMLKLRFRGLRPIKAAFKSIDPTVSTDSDAYAR